MVPLFYAKQDGKGLYKLIFSVICDNLRQKAEVF